MRKKIFNFGNRKQVFIDWMKVEAGRGNISHSYDLAENVKNAGELHNYRPNYSPYGIELKVFKPKVSKEPILRADKPWEAGFIGSYINLIQEEDKIRLYYEAYPEAGIKDLQTLFCYAEAKYSAKPNSDENGAGNNELIFEKPELNLVEWNGSKKNNIIFTTEMHPNKQSFHGACVFKDTNENCEENAKYKLVHCSSNHAKGEGDIWAAISPDGINWQVIDHPIIKTWADTQTIVKWDEKKQKYIGFFRSWHYNRRQIYYSETEEFYNWPDPVPVISSLPTLRPDVDFYTNAFLPWPGTDDAFLMMPTCYRRTIDNLFVLLLGTSNDNLNQWNVYNDSVILDGEFLPYEFVGGFYLGHGLIIDKKTGTYSLPLDVPEYFHNEPRKSDAYSGKVFLVTWREDGFTGIFAESKGEFWTSAGHFKGNRLLINAWTYPGGYIKVGLYDRMTNRPLPGHSVDECVPITGDLYGHDNPIKIWHVLKWNSDEYELEDFDDVAIMLHFQIFRGCVHGFKFE
ncbi:MAG: hypothetical protein ACTSU2_10985 [Promethearchaeota archaeon]